MSKAIKIIYEISPRPYFFDENIKFSFSEYFIPYSSSSVELKKYLQGYDKNTTKLFKNFKECNFGEFETYELLEGQENPNVSNILSDVFFSFYSMLKNNDNDILFDKEWSLSFIGFYSELFKYYITKIKYDLSIIFLSKSNQDLLDKNENELLNEMLSIISSHYSYDTNNSRQLNPLNSILYCLNSNYTNNIRNAIYVKLNFSLIEKMIYCFRHYSKMKYANPYLTSNDCFCLADTGKDVYLALSGNDYNVNKNEYIKLGDNIRDQMQKAFPKRNFINCHITNETCSYGFYDNNQRFKLINTPIKVKDYSKKIKEVKNKCGKDLNSLENLYGCCERKIITQIGSQNKMIFFYCKYAPCMKCKPAINTLKNYRFLAYAKNPKTFLKYFNKNKDKYSIFYNMKTSILIK